MTDLPAQKSGQITFGCLNNFCKVSDATLELWAQTLAAVPESRMLLHAPEGISRERVLEKLPADRVDFAPRLPRRKYMEQYPRIDICLDTLPYNGHTTSLDAFWMGVPVVTQIGNTVVGRAGWSQLCNLDLRELAASSPEEFVEIAQTLAGNLSRLMELRGALRDRMRQSPLMHAQNFARHMEAAYRRVWHDWCQMRWA